MIEHEILKRVRTQLRQSLLTVDDELKALTEEFVTHMTERAGDEDLVAILFYGSCLNPGMKKATSTPDYYVIVRSYKSFHKSVHGSNWLHAALNRAMPPNIYRFKSSKYSVISLEDLKRETSLRAHDVYNLGRISKRTALCWWQNDRVIDEMSTASMQAALTAMRYAIPLLDQPFTLEQAVFASLRISYQGEIRVEALDKVERIFNSQKVLYLNVFSNLLSYLVETEDWLKSLIKRGVSEVDTFQTDGCRKRIKKSKRFVFVSRLRAVLRWPKFIVTVRDWPEYMVQKIARSRGLTIELTEKERKYPLLYVWKYLWILKKQKLLK